MGFVHLDFETDAFGNPLAAGDSITDQYAELGLTITTGRRLPSRAIDGDSIGNPMIFDSENPTGGDYDLATLDQGNVLIISEDGDASDPDDNAFGGVFIFNWEEAVQISEIGLLDIDSNEFAVITTMDEDNNETNRWTFFGDGDNSLQNLTIQDEGVYGLVVQLFPEDLSPDSGTPGGSGAITHINFSTTDVHPGETTTLEAVQDTYVRTDLDVRRNDNYGRDRILGVGTGRGGGGQPSGAADAMRSLIQFDTTSLTGEVESATLQLAIHSFGSSPSDAEFEVEVHRITDGWTEGNGAEEFESNIPGAVGVDRASGVAWAAIDSNNEERPDFDSTIVATTTVTRGVDNVGDVIEWDITALVQEWQANPSDNFGLILVDNSSDGSVFKELRFGSREGDLYPDAFPDEVTGPRLSITTSSNGGGLDDLLIGKNVIEGDAGDNRLVGTNKGDAFLGGAGDDIYVGGKGADIFVLNPGEGVDIIRDFRLYQGDKIYLGSDISFEDLTISRFGRNGATLSYDGQDIARVQSTRFNAINTSEAFI